MRAFPLLVAVVLALPGAVFAPSPASSASPSAINSSVAPTSPVPSVNAPHPSMPWSGVANPYGQLMRYIVMPAQPVQIDSPTTGALGEVVLEPRVVQIPGYTMAETTAGYYVPERWVLEHVGPGSYQWRLAPPQFFKK
ncbi:MAG TPA: hypothetical protein VGU22_08500 [Methylomirabilota bacterium]|nr:hypothetical protein [Methylomirabilota bacterium]